MLFKGVPQATSYEGAELDLPAALVADFQNPHDSRAVAVWVGGQHVGFLAREYAAVWAPRVASLAERGEYFEFPARTWASVRRDRTSARVSVWASDPALMRPCNSFPSEPFTVLPRGSAVQVTREEDHMDVLTKYATVEGTPLIATLHNVKEVRPRSTVDAIEVRLDGQRVGILSPTQTANVGPLVQYLEERHRVPVARAVAKGNALKIDVVLYVQKAQEVDESWLEGIGPVASTPSPSEPPSIDD
ncbi:hypothetical protein ATL40_1468 [Serinibacter salmoneus]|uniref:HIRAN domain-containing protein n=1 Tax=Serinibacter salmoneus TaxID=556530 RepID=A0A2A9D1R9_9MICO|nr:hypothetical protein ATL40_1468 [Serinibacter salmoneus]